MFSLIAPLLLSLHGDQAAWITPAQARRGAELVRKAGRVAWFCEPCGDPLCREETVQSATSGPVDAGYHQVTVNQQEADLAYLFIPKDGKWANVALLMKLPVHDVSRTLPLSKCEPDLSVPPDDDPPASGASEPDEPARDDLFTVSSSGANRFGSSLLQAWNDRPQSGGTATTRLQARILPEPGIYWTEGNTVVLHRTDDHSDDTPYRLLELRLQRSGAATDQTLCDAKACTFDGAYEILDCHERAKDIQICTLRATPSEPAPPETESVSPPAPHRQGLPLK